SPRCCWRRAWRTSPLRSDEAPVRRQKTTPRISWALSRTRSSKRSQGKETVMLHRVSVSMIMVAVAAAAVGAVISVSTTRTSAQAPSLKTRWGEPDLQGIWTVETDTPFQRSPKFANQEFFTEEQRAEFDRIRSTLHGRDNRGERGSERDVSGAYNNVFGALKRTGRRTSAVV